VDRKVGVMVLIALVFIFACQPRLSVYSVEEELSVLMSIAALLILLILPVIVFLLLWNGARFVFLRLRGVFDPTRPVARPPRPMSQRLPVQ